MPPISDSEYNARQRALDAAGIDAATRWRYEVHHIVEKKRTIAEPARLNLASVGIALHAMANLLPLPKPHQPIHTIRYSIAVNQATTLARPYGCSTMTATLEQIKDVLRKKGRFP